MIDWKAFSGRANLYFLRHGESAGNIARVAQGRADFPLSDLGREQARQAGRWFADCELDLILTSPLLRASETAEIIAREAGIGTVQEREELIEIDIGPISGLRWDEATARHPEIMRQFHMHSWDGVPGAEHSDVLFHRAEAIWRLLLDLAADGAPNILAVTHSGLLQWIIKASLDHQEWLPLFPMRNCGVFHFLLNNRTFSPDPMADRETPSYYYQWKLIDYQV
jgi:broad specificity phosphatase PhoE